MLVSKVCIDILIPGSLNVVRYLLYLQKKNLFSVKYISLNITGNVTTTTLFLFLKICDNL